MIPFSHQVDQESLLQYYFIGKMTAKAIYDRILIKPVLSKLFLNLILDTKNELEDLKYLDSDIY